MNKPRLMDLIKEEIKDFIPLSPQTEKAFKDVTANVSDFKPVLHPLIYDEKTAHSYEITTALIEEMLDPKNPLDLKKSLPSYRRHNIALQLIYNFQTILKNEILLFLFHIAIRKK